MKLMRNIPFYSNTPDNTHCFQAVFKMVLKYFWPEKDFSWEELEKITAKQEGLWTWPMAGLLWMQAHGFEVRNIEEFDYEEFAQLGEQYLEEYLGPEVAKTQIEHSSIAQERIIAKKFMEKVRTEKRIPVLDDVKSLLRKGYILVVNLNSCALNEREGYSGHSVVITSLDEEYVFLHDPGLPARENRKVALSIFEKAWAYPDEKMKNIAAIR